MIGLKILFYVVASFISLIFIVAFMGATAKDRTPTDRYIDVLVGVVVFIMFLLLVKVFGGYIV